MRLSLFVSSQHVQNTSFCVGDASRTSYTYTSLLYSRAVHVQTDTQVLQNEHACALSGRLPPAEPSDARCERARQREAPSGRQQARKARSRLSGTCVPTHARSGIDTCQSHLSKSPVGKHLSETPVKVTCHSHLPNELAMGVRLRTQWGVRVQSTRCAHRVESSRTSSRRRNDCRCRRAWWPGARREVARRPCRARSRPCTTCHTKGSMQGPRCRLSKGEPTRG